MSIQALLISIICIISHHRVTLSFWEYFGIFQTRKSVFVAVALQSLAGNSFTEWIVVGGVQMGSRSLAVTPDTM